MRAIRPPGEQDALYAISAETIAELVRVHVTTARRWKRYGDAPYAAEKLIELLSTRDLGLIDPKWNGWMLKDGRLVAPTGMEFSSGEILAIPFVQQLVASYQRDARLPRQADWIEGKYLPARELDDAVPHSTSFHVA